MSVLVYAVVDDALSPKFPLGEALEVFVRRVDAERFVEEVGVTIRGSGYVSATRRSSYT